MTILEKIIVEPNGYIRWARGSYVNPTNKIVEITVRTVKTLRKERVRLGRSKYNPLRSEEQNE